MTPTADDLRRWRDDVVAFATEAVHVRDPETGVVGPLKLAEHQVAWLREATRRDPAGRFVHKVAVASWPKRQGKSLCVALVLAWRLATRTGERAGIIANSERQAQSNLYDMVCSMFRNSPVLAGYVTDDSFGTRQLKVAGLNNTLNCFPANHRTVQGIAFSCLACDELHASEDGGRAWTFASNQTEAADAQALVASQAGMPTDVNPLWRLYKAAEAGKPGVFFSYGQEVTMPWAVRRAEQARHELLPLEFEYLWRNEWGASGAKLFPPALVAEAAMDYAEPQTADEWRELKRQWGWLGETAIIGGGLDRAGVSTGGDRTVWSVCARCDLAGREPDFRLVRLEVLPTGSEAEVMAAWDRTREVFGEPHKVQLEAYQCADLANRIPFATLEAPSSQRQQGLFGRLFRVLSEGRFRFPADAGVDPKTGAKGLFVAELLAFEAESVPGGLMRFGVQRGGHDDTCYAVAWSLDSVASAVRPAAFMQRL